MRIIGTRTLVVVVALVGFELLLRHAFGLGQWTVTEQSERYGWRMLPDQQARSRDLTVPEQINSFGFRDREWAPPRRAPDGSWEKSSSVLRVALVGNSMTYGTSVPVERTFARQLEDRLRERLAAAGDPRTPLVMNFAVQGYVFEQMARVYEDEIRPFRPDLLVVPFHPHDIVPMKPAADDPDYEFREWILRSATYDLLNREVINRWIPPPPAPDAKDQRAWQAIDDAVTEKPFSRDNQRFWVAAAARLDQVRQQVAEDGGRLVVLTLPRWRDVFEPKLLSAASKWGPWCKGRPDTLHVDATAAFRPPMEALRQDFLATGMDWNATYDFTTVGWKDAQGGEHRGDDLAHAGDSLFLLNDTGHYTEAGHALLGEVLFEGLAEAGWLP